jgi:hypothetical protein
LTKIKEWQIDSKQRAVLYLTFLIKEVDFKTTSKKSIDQLSMGKFEKHFIYWILPSMIVGVCMCVYFFDILGMSYLIAPEYNREFGILENIQLFIIFAIIFLSFKNFRKAATTLSRLIFIVIFLGTIFICLEEIDYGLHYYEYLMGLSTDQLKMQSWNKDVIRNLHNQGNLTRYIKSSVYVLFALVIVSPLILKKLKVKIKYIDYFAPQHYFIYTLLAMILLNSVGEYIDDSLKDEKIVALNKNVSEFEEVFIYYIVLLYLWEKSKLLLAFGDKELMNEYS